LRPRGAPITTVLLSDQLLQPHAGRAVEAMRKIDPSLRVVLMTTNAMALDWQSKGLDDCVTIPLAPGDLGKLFEEDMLAPATTQPSMPPPVEQIKAPAPVQPAPTPELRTQPHPPKATRADEKPDPPPAPAPSISGGIR
jgi:hypothetical protein